MRKTGIRLMAFAVCLALSLAFFGCGEEVGLTAEEMIHASATENLLKQYSSFQAEYTYDDGTEGTLFASGNMVYKSILGAVELYIDGKPCYLLNNGDAVGILFVKSEPVDFPMARDPFFPNERLDVAENVVKSVKRAGKLYVTTEMSVEDSATVLRDMNAEVSEGDTLRSEYTLDAETKAVLEQKRYTVSASGRKKLLVSAKATYNGTAPDIASVLYLHATANVNLRTVTVITDPDTPEEESYSLRLLKGDEVLIYGPDGYDGLFTDRACTKRLTEDVDTQADLQLYIKKIS